MACNLVLGPMVAGRLIVLSTGRLATELAQVQDVDRLHLCLVVNLCTVAVPFLLHVQNRTLLAQRLLLTMSRALTVALILSCVLTGLIILALDEETMTTL